MVGKYRFERQLVCTRVWRSMREGACSYQVFNLLLTKSMFPIEVFKVPEHAQKVLSVRTSVNRLRPGNDRD